MMKRNTSTILAGLLVVALGSCQGKKQEPVTVEAPSITWLTETTHDFGTYSERETVACDFVYRNDGPGEFTIERMEPSCSCTRASHQLETVAPGETDTIHVTYNGNGFVPGYFIKDVKIIAGGKIIQHLNIKGYYAPPEEESE